MNLPKWIEDSIVYPVKNKYSYKYLIYDADEGFSTTKLPMSKEEINIEFNYNDDIPDEKIKEVLSSEESGLVILHGEPGTGKSTYIRHLITEVNKPFVYIDQSSFDAITDSSFISMLLNNKNSVFILEDCEVLLAEREAGNSKIATLLNMTDGLFGDSFKIKILCTFNTDIRKLDKALLRKGRMKMKYKFNKLVKEKVKVLADKLGLHIKEDKDMSLADIYNYNEETNNKDDQKRNIGFN